MSMVDPRCVQSSNVTSSPAWPPGQTIKVRVDVDAIDEVPTYRGEGRNFE
jgi:hypothetical protein